MIAPASGASRRSPGSTRLRSGRKRPGPREALTGESVGDRKLHAFFVNTAPPCLSPESQSGGKLRLPAPTDTHTHQAKQAIQTSQHKQGGMYMQPHMLLFHNDVRVAGSGRRLLGDTVGGRAVPQSTKAAFMWRSRGPGDYFCVCVCVCVWT